jgi:uncharacterized protein (DUF1697 family)
MNPFVGLIRGINVGGNKIVRMADLRALLEGLGYSDVKTILQSGNFVFSAKDGKHGDRIRRALDEEMDLDAVVLTYSAVEWKGFLTDNPMPEEAADHPSRFLLCLAETPIGTDGLVDAMEKATESERVEAVGGRLYLSLPEGIGTSKMLASKEWGRYAGQATMRNWNTVTKLAEMAIS